MPYAIYPPIGFARLGNSPDAFFIGPERPGAPGVEIAADGSELPVVRFKDAAFRMKRQAARFRIFDVSVPEAPGEAVFPAGTTIRWSVTLTNRKDAVRRPNAPPPDHVAVVDDPARADRVITATASVSGVSASPQSLGGTYRGTPVKLGDISTDGAQRLIALGGHGLSASLNVPPAPIGGNFYNNADWFDDVGDGPVTATIEVPGAPAETARGSWLIVAPPDFAPVAFGVVTLHDVIRQVAIDQGWIQQPAQFAFESDIRPMIERASSLQHVDHGVDWDQISNDWSQLADSGPATQILRRKTAAQVREVENALNNFELRQWQRDALDAWEAGSFSTGAAPDRGDCDLLTRAALDATVGQGFFPGIEAGVNITDPARFEATGFEFRLAHAANRSGDLTALMAQPWQADFLKCQNDWWPAQRPDRAMTADGTFRPWLRPTMDHQQLVENVMKLGVVALDGSGRVVEQGRDPMVGV